MHKGPFAPEERSKPAREHDQDRGPRLLFACYQAGACMGNPWPRPAPEARDRCHSLIEAERVKLVAALLDLGGPGIDLDLKPVRGIPALTCPGITSL